MATPTGEFVLGRAPHNAAGPDLRQLFIGSEGRWGHHRGSHCACVVSLPSPGTRAHVPRPYAAGVAAFRDLAQSRVTADVMRLSDAPETRTTLHMSGPQRPPATCSRYLSLRKVTGGCMAILGWEGYSKSFVSARRKAAWAILKDHGAVSSAAASAIRGAAIVYDRPYLRDTLLDQGYIVETLGHHPLGRSASPARAVGDALVGALRSDGGDPYVMSHVSHVYETGASLYFTVITPSTDDPVASGTGPRWPLWRRSLRRAPRSPSPCGGRDHAPWLGPRSAPTAWRCCVGSRGLVDPTGTLNPGVLIPGDVPGEHPGRSAGRSSLTGAGGLPNGESNVQFRSGMTVELIKATASDADVVWAARVSTRVSRRWRTSAPIPKRSRG